MKHRLVVLGLTAAGALWTVIAILMEDVASVAVAGALLIFAYLYHMANVK